MRLFLLTLFISGLSISLSNAQVKVVSFAEVEDLIKSNSDKIRIINFWATWCAPCVKEIPYFQATAKQYEGEVELILVSLDFKQQLDKVERFINERNIDERVLLLDDLDYNSWIDKVDPDWSGAIPANLIINTNTGKRKFTEGEVSKEDLVKYIEYVKS